jgi:hypothetical protein
VAVAPDIFGALKAYIAGKLGSDIWLDKKWQAHRLEMEGAEGKWR